MRRICIAAVLAVGLVAPGCAGRGVITIPETPVVLDATAQGVFAGTIKVLGILESAGYVTVAAQELELTLAGLQVVNGETIPIPGAQALIPRQVHDRIAASFRQLSERALAVIGQLETGSVTNWAELRSIVEPVLRDVEALARLVQTVTLQVRGGASLQDIVGTIGSIVQSAMSLIDEARGGGGLGLAAYGGAR